MENYVKKIAVIGGGAAGMMAAGTAAFYGASVTIFEHTDRLGKKLAITGKGRCNVTNNTSVEGLLQNVTKNARFLYSAFNAFTSEDTIALFENLGVKLKTERGRRVFPESEKAKDIVDALKKYSSKSNVIYENVRKITRQNDNGFIVSAKTDRYFDAVILATGGKSYPLTGSDGSGYSIAARLGHRVTELTPSLVPFESLDDACTDLQGLSLKNVKISLKNSAGKLLFEDFGEMLFTHFGVSGPIILSSSAHVRDADVSDLTLYIDLKPALDEKTLDARLLSEFSQNSNKDFINSLSALLPSKMIVPFIKKTQIPERRKVNSITKDERRVILQLLKSFPVRLSGLRPIEEAIITSGGVDTKEISPKDMQSKIVPGLYFAGEVIDVDAYTGGYNLQIAFSTAYLAGKSSAGF
jgi:predicted Rossmann fold flavoprotein